MAKIEPLDFSDMDRRYQGVEVYVASAAMFLEVIARLNEVIAELNAAGETQLGDDNGHIPTHYHNQHCSADCGEQPQNPTTTLPATLPMDEDWIAQVHSLTYRLNDVILYLSEQEAGDDRQR